MPPKKRPTRQETTKSKKYKLLRMEETVNQDQLEDPLEINQEEKLPPKTPILKMSVATPEANCFQDENKSVDLAKESVPFQNTETKEETIFIKEERCDDLDLILQSVLANESTDVQNAEIKEEIIIKEESGDDVELILEKEESKLLNIVDETQNKSNKKAPIFSSDNIRRTYSSPNNKNSNIDTRRTYSNPKNKLSHVDNISNTYSSAKNTNSNMNEDFVEDMCILCRNKSIEPLEDISEFESTVHFVTNIIIWEHKLPKKACNSCIKMLKLCYRFKNQVVNAHKNNCDQEELTTNNFHEPISTNNVNCLNKNENNDESEDENEMLCYVCIVCGAESTTPTELKEHYLYTHSEIHCKECNFRTTNISLFLEHKDKHLKYNKFLEQRKDHKSVMESKDQCKKKLQFTSYVCIICGVKYKNSIELKVHYSLNHNEMDCKECNFKTTDIGSFLGHRNVHRKL